MTKHILCSVDLTHQDDAKAILAEAGRLAGLEGAGLSVVTVVPDYGMSFVGSFFEEGTLKKATSVALDTLHDLTDDVLKDFGKVQCIVEVGSVYEKVLAAKDKCGADLIVLGAHKPDFADRLLGPNAARIVRHADVSVNVLRL